MPAPAHARRRHRWTGLTWVAMAAALVAACGSATKHPATTPTTASLTTTTPPGEAGAATTTTPPGEAGATSTTTLPANTTTTAAGASFATISGTYYGGTADSGWLYIRPDGASRLRGPDDIACPDCATAGSPIAVLDFSLTSISSRGAGASEARGTIVAASDPTWARQLSGSATVGSTVSLTVAPGGHLSLSVLPGNDVLDFSSKQAPPSTASPCTVAAVSTPIGAAANGQFERVGGVSCSADGEWAAASVAIGQGQGGIDAVKVLAGNGSTWVLVDRPTVCNNHDVTPSFFTAACGSD